MCRTLPPESSKRVQEAKAIGNLEGLRLQPARLAHRHTVPFQGQDYRQAFSHHQSQ